jgi:hypothetical protein
MYLTLHLWRERATDESRGCQGNFGTWRRICSHCDLRTEAEETVNIELIIQNSSTYGGKPTDKTNVFVDVRMKKRAMRETMK